jgi:4-amino-4-deoxychorismate lyase
MYPFIETIRLLDGQLMNLSWHQIRFNRTRSEVFKLSSHPLLSEEIRVPEEAGRGLFKCRVTYGKEIEQTEFEPYRNRKIRSLKIIRSDTVSYPYKSADRSSLEALYDLREDCDDIMIIKKGCITDSFYANVALWDTSGWFTPDTPLLQGTMRDCLLAAGILKEKRIMVSDLGGFQRVRLINAMNPLTESPDILVESVIE